MNEEKMTRCWVCKQRKPLETAEVIKIASGFGRAYRCRDCAR